MKKQIYTIISDLKCLPTLPGVYLFKDAEGQCVYIGKAKNLKKRGQQYVQRLGIDGKVDAIFQASVHVEHVITRSELDALLMEAQLVQSHQPTFNVLLKSGQPFVYLFVSNASLPELKIVRNQKQKGIYFGPFLEKNNARKVYDFLMRTFRLKLCKKKIKNGCLNYHLGLCAGTCRADFDQQAYLVRLELAKDSLRQGHKKFLRHLQDQIAQHSARMEYEKAREVHAYYQAFEKVFDMLESKPTDIEARGKKDLWILMPDGNALFVFSEREGVLTKKRVFYFPLDQAHPGSSDLEEYFVGFYRLFAPPAVIVTNFVLESESKTLALFLRQWHKKEYDIDVMITPQRGHMAALVRLGLITAQQEEAKQKTVTQALKAFLKLPILPHTIDCFDISHKQGMAMVGSCVRFNDGQPDKALFRHFHIKTVVGNDDYASLREIVSRRYKGKKDVPDLILIDGGKGQLNAVAGLVPTVEIASLAKREETVFSKRLPDGIKLDQASFVGQMLMALRDYAHHFAISFHRQKERKSLKD